LEAWRRRATEAWWWHTREPRWAGRESWTETWHTRRHAGWHSTGHSWRRHPIGHRTSSHRWRRHAARRRHHSHSTTSRHAPSWTRYKPGLFIIINSRRCTLIRQTDNRLAAQDDKAQRPLLLNRFRHLGIPLLALLLDPSELFAISQDEVHVLVKGEHLAHEGPSVVQGDFDDVVEKSDHSAAFGLGGRHD